MRLTPFELNGRTYYLLLNAAALFSIYDQFGQDGSIVDHIKGNDKDSFAAICWYLETLSTQGELYRRWEGNDKGAHLSADRLELELSPLDIPKARAAIQEAVCAGFLQEEDDEKPMDSFTLEYEKKTGDGLPKACT